MAFLTKIRRHLRRTRHGNRVEVREHTRRIGRKPKKGKEKEQRHYRYEHRHGYGHEQSPLPVRDGFFDGRVPSFAGEEVERPNKLYQLYINGEKAGRLFGDRGPLLTDVGLDAVMMENVLTNKMLSDFLSENRVVIQAWYITRDGRPVSVYFERDPGGGWRPIPKPF